MEAMDVMEFNKEEKKNIMTVECACLHLSNVDVLAISDDESKINPDNEHLDTVLIIRLKL